MAFRQGDSMFSILGLAAERIFDYWRLYQVELRGRYSCGRIQALRKYWHDSNMPRIWFFFCFTPIPCIILLVIMDSYHLADPNAGSMANYVFWIRNYVSVAFMTIGILDQFRTCLPRLPLPVGPMLAVTILATTAGLAWQIGCSHIVGFPLPFGLLVGTTSWTPALIFGCYTQWSKALRRDRSLVEDMAEYVVAFLAQVSMTVIYPLYIYVFTSLSGLEQNAFVITLALIKIFLRNWMSRFLRNMDDVKPEVLIFNIEVFNALYVSCSLQSSTSSVTTAVVMVIDAIQACITLTDLDALDSKIRPLLAKIPPDLVPLDKCNLLDVSSELLHDPQLRNHPKVALKHFHSRRNSTMEGKYLPVPAGETITITDAVSNTLDVSPWIPSSPTERIETKAHSVNLVPTVADTSNSHGPASAVVPMTSSVHPSPRNPEATPLASTLTLDERIRLVRASMSLLFLTEFVGLVEFIEMMMPVIYGAYLVAMSHLPNRQYYPRLAALSEHELSAMIRNVLAYATLELISFVMITNVIYRKFRFSPVHQVAFVLEKQMFGIQSKLVLWTFYIVQCMLYHSGEYL